MNKLINKKHILVFDVESTKLHGKAFAVGAVVMDLFGNIIDQMELLATYPMGECNEWVRTNVLPSLEGMPTCITAGALGDAFYEFYQKHKADAEVWVDCGWPVEANFLSSIVNYDPITREFEMPYPLKDISSLIDVDINRNEMSGLKCLRAHHPLDDAKASALCLLKRVWGIITVN